MSHPTTKRCRTTRVSILICLAAASCWWPTSYAQAPATPVVVNEVKLAALDLEKPASGMVHSRQFMQVMAGTSGRLDWIAEPGSIIETGKELARLDIKPLQLRLHEQELQAQRARINRDFYQREIQRIASLQASDYAAANERDQLELSLALAANDLHAANNRIAQLQDDIERGTIRAPFTGVISDQQRYAGEELSRTDVLARLNGTEQLELRAQLPLAWLTQLQTGTVVTVQAHEQEWIGTVRRLIPTGDMSTQTFEARIDLPKDASLALGELAHLRLPQHLADAQLQVPRDALVLRREAAYVFRVSENSTVERIAVTVERGQGEWIAVLGQLKAGDQVVVRGAERLQAEQAVQVLRNLAADDSLGTS
ncbi:MAG: efflux RND transporter periplasmic adaptor subunit [Oceanococcus sp.]